MMKAVFLAASLAAATWSGHARADVQSESFDVLGSVMETHRKEINAKDIIASNKEEAIRYREKIIAGWWEFMQANSAAQPGEYCAASFLRAKRVKGEHVDGISDGMMVTLFGPGGRYRGALLGFSPLSKDHAFPKLARGQPVRVTLKQGNEKPVTLNAIYTEVSATAPPLLLFAVPSIDALMNGMADNWHFEVLYEGKSIADIEWHDGLQARDKLKQCLAGKSS
jgi:hypothetical protein